MSSSLVPSLPTIKPLQRLQYATPVVDAAGAQAALELAYFKAYSQYRRRNYEQCIECCNGLLLQAGSQAAASQQIFNGNSSGAAGGGGAAGDEELLNNSSGSNHYNNNNGIRYSSNLQRTAAAAASRQPQQQQPGGAGLPTWLLEGVWQLKMRALTQRVYVDDLETNDADDETNEEVEFERIATAARPGTSIKTAFVPRPKSSCRPQSRQRTGNGNTLPHNQPPGTSRSSEGRSSLSRPTSAMARPGTNLSRPGSALGGNRPASRCGTASRVRATSAAAYNVGDATAALYQASRLNPTIYAERQVLVKTLFQFLFYHQADVQKAYTLCEAVLAAAKQRRPSIRESAESGTNIDWWWLQQMGRCLLTLKYPRKAESFLLQALAAFPHPDTYLLLSRVYQRLQLHPKALELISQAVDRHPFDVAYRAEQARIYDGMTQRGEALQIYRLLSRLNPINIEALASIALNYFYDNNPEMALMYYRRILALGVHNAELYCNIALCCLYGGQIDLVLPCFTRALNMSETVEQRADIWYNLSFVAITTGDFTLARRCLQLCLSCDARNGAALNNLAVLAAHSGDLLKAKSYLQAAQDVISDSVELQSNLKYMDEHYKL